MPAGAAPVRQLGAGGEGRGQGCAGDVVSMRVCFGRRALGLGPWALVPDLPPLAAPFFLWDAARAHTLPPAQVGCTSISAALDVLTRPGARPDSRRSRHGWRPCSQAPPPSTELDAHPKTCRLPAPPPQKNKFAHRVHAARPRRGVPGLPAQGGLQPQAQEPDAVLLRAATQHAAALVRAAAGRAGGLRMGGAKGGGGAAGRGRMACPEWLTLAYPCRSHQ